MSDPIAEMRDGARDGAQALLARTAAAGPAAQRGLRTAIDDFLLAEDGRLDERTRAALAKLLRALIDTVESEIRGHGVRLLRAQEETALADSLEAGGGVAASLQESGLLRDPGLMGELIARVRLDLLASAMPVQAQDDPKRPSLLNRLAEQPDRLLAQAAGAVLVAESRRRSLSDAGPLAGTDLPAELHHKLVWHVAAALRLAAAGPRVEPALDRALADAAQRSLAAHDEGDRLEAAALRLAVAIDARPDELAQLLTEALGDRRVALFTALLAHALRMDHEAARAMVVDARDGRLWVALRALGLDREAVARLGVALSEADPRLDMEAFADSLDSIMAIEPDEACDALAPLRLPADYRAAMLALESGPR